MGDIWGGLAAMLVALPSAIAFGLVIYAPLGSSYAAQGALAGMIGTIAIGITAPLFGGTPRLVSAPCAPAAALMGALAMDLQRPAGAAQAGALGPEQILLLSTLVVVLAGTMQLLFGAAGGGRLIKYIPYPVVAGFLSAVGLLIVMGQLPKLLGVPLGTGLWAGITSPLLWQWSGLLVGGISVAAMVLAPRISQAVPAPIVGLAGGIVTYLGLGLWMPDLLTVSGNALVIGPIAGAEVSLFGSMAHHLAALSHVNLQLAPKTLELLVVSALTLALLLSIDTLKTCVIVDAMTHTRHHSNRELMGQGLGNLASAFVGGVRGAGTAGATVVNLESGGRTRLSGILAGVFALAVFFLLGDLVAWVPLAALAGILIVVGARMVDWKSVLLLRRESTVFDFGVVATVVVTALSSTLITAAGMGLALAILLFLREQIRGTVVRRKSYGHQFFSKKSRLPDEIAILEDKGSQTAIYELHGSLFFGTTDQLLTELEADLKSRKYIILDMRRVHSVDFTAARILEQIQGRLAERHGLLIFTQIPYNLPTGQDLQRYFDHVGLTRSSRKVRVFPGLNDAMEWVEDRILKEARLLQPEQGAPLELHEIDLLKGFDAETLEALSLCVKTQSFEAGQKIFSQGDAGDELFLIRQGTIRIVLPLNDGKGHHLATFARGDFFGDMAFLDEGLRSADAITSAPTDLYVLSRARFDAVADKYPAMGQKAFARLARALAIRLRQTNSELSALQES